MSYSSETNSTMKNSDSRYLPRWAIDNKVSFSYDNISTSFSGKTKNLSCSGVCFSASEDLQLDQDVNLSIYLSEEVQINVKGKIVWTNTLKDDNQFGVHFSNLTTKGQETILNYAFEMDKTKLADHWFKGW